MDRGSLCPEKADRLVLRRVEDAFKGAVHDSRRFVGFLDLHERAVAERYALSGRAECNYAFFGGYPGAERVYLGVFPAYERPDDHKFPLKGIRITYKGPELSHRDFLGAVLALGIKREKVGDIVTGNGECSVFAEDAVAELIVSDLKRAGRESVECRFLRPGAEVRREERFAGISGSVASDRLDCVVSAICRISRACSDRLIKSGLVTVDFTESGGAASKVSSRSTISVRGYGRFAVDSIGPETKKGRLRFSARKYL